MNMLWTPSLSFGIYVHETSECSTNLEEAEESVHALMEGQGIGLDEEPHLQHDGEGQGPLQHAWEESDVEGNDFRAARDGHGEGGTVMCPS
jgi:hypothetical protein